MIFAFNRHADYTRLDLANQSENFIPIKEFRRFSYLQKISYLCDLRLERS